MCECSSLVSIYFFFSIFFFVLFSFVSGIHWIASVACLRTFVWCMASSHRIFEGIEYDSNMVMPSPKLTLQIYEKYNKMKCVPSSSCILPHCSVRAFQSRGSVSKPERMRDNDDDDDGDGKWVRWKMRSIDAPNTFLSCTQTVHMLYARRWIEACVVHVRCHTWEYYRFICLNGDLLAMIKR